MTITVYALVSPHGGRIYVGMTTDIHRRLTEHNVGGVSSTKAYRPWSLLYSETVVGRAEARVREKQLKSGYGKEFLKRIRDGQLPK